MTDLRKLFRKPRASAAELTAAAGQLATERDAAAANVSRLEQERQTALLAALLDGDGSAVDRIEADLVAARRRRDEAEAGIAELARRADEARERERQARIDAIYARGTTAKEHGVELLRHGYAEHAAALIEIARQVRAAEAEIAEVNRQLMAAGDLRQIESVDLAARPEARSSGMLLAPIIDGLRLPDLASAEMLMWPENTSIFGVHYAKPVVEFKHVPTNRNPALDDPVPPPAPAVPDYAEHVPSLRKVISRA